MRPAGKSFTVNQGSQVNLVKQPGGNFGAFVYRLGHMVFIHIKAVRLCYALPYLNILLKLVQLDREIQLPMSLVCLDMVLRTSRPPMPQ
jgi:hypothetical protein